MLTIRGLSQLSFLLYNYINSYCSLFIIFSNKTNTLITYTLWTVTISLLLFFNKILYLGITDFIYRGDAADC